MFVWNKKVKKQIDLVGALEVAVIVLMGILTLIAEIIFLVCCYDRPVQCVVATTVLDLCVVLLSYIVHVKANKWFGATGEEKIQ